ncbi:EAL domain-containing protein [Synechococcus sp. CCY 9618]|uniref:EAL domain-containing protein n=1 Tax=Synechococcus sp. CCY 9618 TaxID=2815602 RepID=UPI001C21E964|nr:EAL domain-containing protein [Synechococcus sp. CCY 9618]
MIQPEEIAEGLARGEFFLEYLPILSLDDLRCIGAEALIRWRRPSGLVNPADFIPLIENTPASGVLTYWVIETAAEELRAWLLAHRECHLAINVPPEIPGRGGLYYAAVKAGLLDLASQIILELTERGLPDGLALQGLAGAMQLGTRVALDDVTLRGGANLAVLSRCPFDTIKLDRSLIAQITPDEPRPEWLEGIAALIWSSQLTVIAEGVETAHQLQVLFDAGVQAGQGFHFSRPVAAAGLIAFHRQANGLNNAEEPLASG